MEKGEETDNETLIRSFSEITSATRDEAQFFLKSINWDLDSAVSAFFDNAAGAKSVVPPSPDSTLPSHPARPDFRQRSRSLSPHRLRSKKAAGIKKLNDSNRSGKDDSDETQKDLIGGVSSGMPVQHSTTGQATQAPSSSSRSFIGTGTLLSGETVAPVQDQQPEPLTRTIYFCRNGFGVNDGPPNSPFLESIIMAEGQPADRRIPVQVRLEKRRENYTEAENSQLPFLGVGKTLGTSSSSHVHVSQSAASARPLTRAPAPYAGMVVDQNAPMTSIQIRLIDGTRIVSRFNCHHTVGDIRAFINASRPGTSKTYLLQLMGFPPKLLLDSRQTIEQAGLDNSVVIQRL